MFGHEGCEGDTRGLLVSQSSLVCNGRVGVLADRCDRYRGTATRSVIRDRRNLLMKRYRVYIQKVDDFVAELSYEDDELTDLSHDELLAAAANDVSEQGLGEWNFMQSDTTALSVCEILEDGTEGEVWEINTEV